MDETETSFPCKCSCAGCVASRYTPIVANSDYRPKVLEEYGVERISEADLDVMESLLRRKIMALEALEREVRTAAKELRDTTSQTVKDGQCTAILAAQLNNALRAVVKGSVTLASEWRGMCYNVLQRYRELEDVAVAKRTILLCLGEGIGTLNKEIKQLVMNGNPAAHGVNTLARRVRRNDAPQ
ncbi:hypothetical protein CERSUDRAFT_100199 [Gelatoporia subvermispora B]|uniref:Uncharacterized protein n=1 Tax=Ceriporiopsis subvermispora (strain B) TaxID=914234 RepID=M2QYY1_CERS8|nr:hypothetical protein CERSUDRAFT_100199 [Gelatoporia subvermispora B]